MVKRQNISSGSKFEEAYGYSRAVKVGDTLYISATYSGFGNVDSYLSLEPRDPMLRRDLLKAFPPTPLLTLFPTRENMERHDRMLRTAEALALVGYRYFTDAAFRDRVQADFAKQTTGRTARR